MNDCEKYHVQLMGLLDGELPPEKVAEVNSHLIRCAACRAEYKELRETNGKLRGISFVEPQDEVLENLWRAPYSRWTRNAGVVMVLAGWLTLAFYGVYEFLRDRNLSAIPKLAMAAMVLGFVILLAGFIRERLATYKSDPYKGIQR